MARSGTLEAHATLPPGCAHPADSNPLLGAGSIRPSFERQPLVRPPCPHHSLNRTLTRYLLCATAEHRFLLLGDQFRPRVALEPTTGQLRLIGTVNLCRAGSPQPSYSRPDPCHSIDFTPPRFRFRQSLVARRRSARAYRRPRARPRRSEGVQDMQLDGTAVCRCAGPSSRSPVPVPVAHCAPRMQCRSTPPTLVPRPHRG